MSPPDPGHGTTPTPLDRAAWFSFRALLVAGGGVAALLLAARIRVVLLPIAVAILLAAPLRPVAARLQRRIGRSLAAIVVIFGLAVLVLGALGLAGSAVVADADDLGQAVSEGIDDVRDRLADRGIDEARLDEIRDQLGSGSSGLLSGAASGAVVAGEVLAGLVLSLILAIFVVRDADLAVDAVARRTTPAKAARLRAGVDAAWKALRRYLLGAATLGAVEAVAIGGAVALVGSPLAVPVATFTFVAAFVPLVGAIVAGLVAVLAALVTGGVSGALIVGAVALVVQQLDGDILGPFIYGRATQLHPVAVLLAVTTGTAVAGLPGALLAVPILTVVVAVSRTTPEPEEAVAHLSG